MRESYLSQVREFGSKRGSMAAALFLLFLVCPPGLWAQRGGMDSGGMGQMGTRGQMDPELGNQPLGSPGGPIDREMQRKRLMALNADRQKTMVSDTDRLVKLAAELNAEINSSHQQELTPDQLRTLSEIEKLAHSIREKMSTAPSLNPGLIQPSVAGPSAIPLR